MEFSGYFGKGNAEEEWKELEMEKKWKDGKKGREGCE